MARPHTQPEESGGVLTLTPELAEELAATEAATGASPESVQKILAKQVRSMRAVAGHKAGEAMKKQLARLAAKG
jgi:hypothetical protein